MENYNNGSLLILLIKNSQSNKSIMSLLPNLSNFLWILKFVFICFNKHSYFIYQQLAKYMTPHYYNFIKHQTLKELKIMTILQWAY